jgi:hypothetical protein
MAESATGQIIEGLLRFEALLPDWTEQEGGEDGWEQSVAWWAVAAAGGLVLIDPLVDDWDAIDRLVAGGAAVPASCARATGISAASLMSRAGTTWTSGRGPIQMVARGMPLTTH